MRPVGPPGSRPTRCWPWPSCSSATPWKRARAANKLTRSPELIAVRHSGDEPRRRPAGAPTRDDSWRLCAPSQHEPFMVCSLQARRRVSRRSAGVGRRGRRGGTISIPAESQHREDGAGDARRAGHRQPQSVAWPEDQSAACGPQFSRHQHGRRHLEPCLGGEVGASGKVNFASGTDSPFALFATSRDDTKAKALLAKLRSGSFGQKYAWRDETYNGISIASGTPTVTSEKPVAYSLVDHVVVAASSAAMIHEIIDTDQGRSARLVDSADFKATMKLLASDRVGMGYLAGKSLVAGVKKQMAKPSTLGLPALKTVDDLNALQGIGGAVSATSTGVAFDLAVKLDANQLSPATRQAFVSTRRPDVVLRWIPKSSDAFLAIGNLDQTIKSLLDQYGTDPSVQASTSAIGLTGPQGILPHLTGDLGIEVELGSNSIPSGAILLGTNDSAAMNAFFSQLLGLAAATSQQPPGAGITRTTYRGTVITSWTSASLGQVPGLAPSYAVLGGMGILASNTAEIKAVIDTQAGGSNIAVDSTYRSASTASLTQPAGIVYVNVARVVSALETLRGRATGDTT